MLFVLNIKVNSYLFVLEGSQTRIDPSHDPLTTNAPSASTPVTPPRANDEREITEIRKQEKKVRKKMPLKY